jgi:hypothetical protein
MGVRTRGLDMRAGFKRDAADKAARAEAEAVIRAGTTSSPSAATCCGHQRSGPS